MYGGYLIWPKSQGLRLIKWKNTKNSAKIIQDEFFSRKGMYSYTKLPWNGYIQQFLENCGSQEKNENWSFHAPMTTQLDYKKLSRMLGDRYEFGNLEISLFDLECVQRFIFAQKLSELEENGENLKGKNDDFEVFRLHFDHFDSYLESLNLKESSYQTLSRSIDSHGLAYNFKKVKISIKKSLQKC